MLCDILLKASIFQTSLPHNLPCSFNLHLTFYLDNVTIIVIISLIRQRIQLLLCARLSHLPARDVHQHPLLLRTLRHGQAFFVPAARRLSCQ